MLSMMRPPTLAGPFSGTVPPPVVTAQQSQLPPQQQQLGGGMAAMFAPALAQFEASMGAMESRLTAHITGVEQRLTGRLDSIEAELARFNRLSELNERPLSPDGPD